MVKQEDFAVEQYMDRYESGITYNLGETCCHSLSIDEVARLADASAEPLLKDLVSSRLTYGHIQGSPQLKSAIAGLYDVGAANIVVTNGAIGANFLVFYALVDRGDHVVVVEPSYQQLSSVPRVFGAEVSPLRLRFEDGFLPDLDKLRQLVSLRATKLVVINNPHNPSGVVWSNAVLRQVVDLCRQYGCYVLCDEVYRPLYHTAVQPSSILSFGYERAISTSSMSKAFAMAGIRVGWVATNDAALTRSLLSKRDYNAISVSMVDDKIATFALQHQHQILLRNLELCAKNLAHIQQCIDASGGRLAWVPPQGGSTCFIRVNADVSTMEMCRVLAETHKVLVVPGEVFGCPGFIRIGFGNGEDEVRQGFKIILMYLQNNTREHEVADAAKAN